MPKNPQQRIGEKLPNAFASQSLGRSIHMKKNLFLVYLAFCLIITACSGLKWKHDYKPRSALREDLEDCQRDVRTFRRGYTGGETPYEEQIMINECMQNKGWYR